MIRRATLLLLLLALAACRRAPEPPPAAPKRIDDKPVPIAAPVPDIDSDNLLNLAYGASLVSRTGELNLEASAVHAIDGMVFSVWQSSPGAAAATLVFAFGGPSRVEQLGVTTSSKPLAPEKVRFSASADGRTWLEVHTMQPADRGTKIDPVTPFEARYLRVETIEPAEHHAMFASVHAIGRELRAPERFSFGGCWTINTGRASFVQRGARISGVIEGPRGPAYVDGGVDGRVAKLTWMRGPMWGYAAATLTPDGRGLSAVTWHEDPFNLSIGEAWIGRRCDDPVVTAAIPPAAYLRRMKRWMMAGIVFDAERIVEDPSRDTLDAAAALIRATPARRFRIVARELRNNDPDENKRLTVARVEAIRAALRARGVDVARVEFVAHGSEKIEHEMPSAVQRMLWSRVDLEELSDEGPSAPVLGR